MQKSESEIIVYPNADHGFLADYRPSFNKEAGTDAWRKMLDWFEKTAPAKRVDSEKRKTALIASF